MSSGESLTPVCITQLCKTPFHFWQDDITVKMLPCSSFPWTPWERITVVSTRSVSTLIPHHEHVHTCTPYRPKGFLFWIQLDVKLCHNILQPLTLLWLNPRQQTERQHDTAVYSFIQIQIFNVLLATSDRVQALMVLHNWTINAPIIQPHRKDIQSHCTGFLHVWRTIGFPF